jgi:hypothetical protein
VVVGGYFINAYWWLLMVILFMAIGAYWWLFYWWLFYYKLFLDIFG